MGRAVISLTGNSDYVLFSPLSKHGSGVFLSRRTWVDGTEDAKKMMDVADALLVGTV